MAPKPSIATYKRYFHAYELDKIDLWLIALLAPYAKLNTTTIKKSAFYALLTGKFNVASFKSQITALDKDAKFFSSQQKAWAEIESAMPMHAKRIRDAAVL